MSTIKDNKLLLGLVVGGLVVLGVLVFSIVSVQGKHSDLQASRDSAMNELADVNRQITEREVAKDGQKQEVIYETTGFDPSMIDTDAQFAQDFFEGAFSWKNSEEYNEARAYYERELGEGNSFTTTYLPPDTVIETNDGDLSYIDNAGLRVHMESIDVIPMRVVDDRVYYVAFVKYYPHKNAEDLNNLSALEASEAIVQFTASGERDNRSISEVEAWVGFGSVLNEEG